MIANKEIRGMRKCAVLAASVLAATFVASAPAHADTDTSLSVDLSAEAKISAVQLAGIIYPRDMYIEQSLYAFNEGLAAGLMADPLTMIFTSNDSQFLPFLQQQLAPGVRVFFDNGYADYINLIGDLFARHMTVDQMTRASEFFSSPAGTSFAATSIASMRVDYPALMTGEVPSSQVTDFLSLDHDMMTAELSQMPADQIQDVLMFTVSPAGRIFADLAPEIGQQSFQFGEELAAQNEDVLNKLIEDAVTRYFNQQEL